MSAVQSCIVVDVFFSGWEENEKQQRKEKTSSQVTLSSLIFTSL